MVRIIVAAHGEAAPALLDTGSMILGEMPNTHAVTFLPGQGPEDLLEKYEALVDDAEPTLFLVDLFGGSPYNAAARFAAAHENTEVVAGVNVPMLMEVATANKRANATLERLVAKALKAGQSGVRGAKKPKPPTPAPQTDVGAAASAQPGTAAHTSKKISDFPRDPDKTMNCIFMRIDSRLIHGQVAGAWVGDKQPQTLIAASDSAAQDSLRKELLLQVGPASARTNVLDLAKTIRVYYNPDYQGMKTMIVVERPQDALELIKEGIKVKELNVGGVTFKAGMQQISEAVYADEEHLAAYQELDKLGVPMVLQQVPSSQRVNLMERLHQKGLV
ncbi:MAG: mannose/fructose/sorbose PTS transporter subunit IIA [Corynebacterium sp.]|nr:mannose/fructose/sorbose PTS transporter subunit IIA [Corynebacterium sp.]